MAHLARHACVAASYGPGRRHWRPREGVPCSRWRRRQQTPRTGLEQGIVRRKNCSTSWTLNTVQSAGRQKNGRTGNWQGLGGALVLDAGALIALERGDRQIRAQPLSLIAVENYPPAVTACTARSSVRTGLRHRSGGWSRTHLTPRRRLPIRRPRKPTKRTIRASVNPRSSSAPIDHDKLGRGDTTAAIRAAHHPSKQKRFIASYIGPGEWGLEGGSTTLADR